MGTWATPQLNSCCYVISLRTGAKICGFIALVASLMLAMMSAFKMIQIVHATENRDDFQSIIWPLGIDIGLQITHAVTSCCMLLGAYQERASLVAPWLVTAVATAAAEVLFMPALASRMFVWRDHAMFSLEWTVLTLLLLVDDVYGWLVVFSYYRTIKTGESTV